MTQAFSFTPPPTPPSRDWGDLQVTQLQPPPGEGTCQFDDAHLLCLSLAERPVPMLHRQMGKTYSGLFGKGDFCLAPAQSPLFARWDTHDHYLQIRLADGFLRQVATQTLERDGDSLELTPIFHTRNPHIEAVGLMLLGELQQETAGDRLYVDSLANLLAVQLLREYATTQPQLPVYEGGLPQGQLRQVLAYIDANLEAEIKLADLAQLLDLSPFHFSRLFKQSLGVSPYQYLIRQRVERAKLLLRQTGDRITDIAFQCGFSSHSHLTKQFRQVTGVTPRVYRAN